MRRRAVLFGVVGTISTLFGVGLLVAPDLLLGIGPVAGLVDWLTATDPRNLVLVAGLVAGVYLGIAVRSRPEPDTVPSSSSSDARFESASKQPPETVATERRTPAGTWVDDDVEAAVSDGGAAMETLRSRLFEATAAVYAEAVDVPPVRARELVASGQWTRDPVAASFLAGPDGPTPSVGRQVRLWLTPGRERRRRIERTISAIEQLEAQP